MKRPLLRSATVLFLLGACCYARAAEDQDDAQNQNLLKKIQATHATEASFSILHRALSGEDGGEEALRVRRHIRVDWSLIAGLRRTHYRDAAADENALLLDVGVLRQRSPTLRDFLRATAGPRCGVEYTLNGAPSAGAYASVSAFSLPENSSLNSLRQHESLSGAAAAGTWRAPSALFLQAELRAGRVDVAGPPHGWEQSGAIGAGIELLHRGADHIGGFFFDPTLMSEQADSLRAHLVVQQAWTRFSAGPDFFAQAHRTRRALPLTMGTGLDLPCPPHFGLEFMARVGQDSERGLAFGKFRQFRAEASFLPSLRFLLRAGVQHSNENIGAVRGRSTDTTLALQIQL